MDEDSGSRYDLGMRPWLVLALLLTACTEKPAQIMVKGPAHTLAAAHGIIDLPVFEEKNETIKLRVSAFDDQGRYMGTAKVRWKSLDPTVASVSQTGLVTILGSGSTRVRAETLEVDPSLEADIEVKAVIIDDIEIVTPKAEEGEMPKLPMGEFLAFEAVVRNDRGEVIEGARINWESTTWAGTISVDGKLEGRAIGKTTVMARAENGDSDELEIEVIDWTKKKRRR